MGMKRKRLAYVKKYGKKFAAWLSKARPAAQADPAPEPEPQRAPQVRARPVPKVEKAKVEELVEEGE